MIEWPITLCNSHILDQLYFATNPIMHQSHIASFFNRNMYMCTFLLQNDALWDIGLMHCGIYEMDDAPSVGLPIDPWVVIYRHVRLSIIYLIANSK